MVLPDTIVAISTPPGRGGIGVVRLAGPDAVVVAERLVRLRARVGEAAALGDLGQHARVRRARVLDPAAEAGGSLDGRLGGTLDEALVTVFHAPRSYTGDTLVEIAAHGSPVVLEAVLRSALAEGARMGLAVRLAEPGEFTQRAFLAGRLDLTQAEAVHDLIAAQTLDQARVAAQQLGGALARQLAAPKGSLLHLIALLEAGMDFASGELDDVDVVPAAAIAAGIAEAREPMAALAATFRRGQLLRNGAGIALIGPPNAGKSSLFNRLLERDRAIVTAMPGTTRDTLEETLSLGGMPIRLIDTAGLREADELSGDAEALGIARTRETLADADVVLLVHDATQPLTEAEQALAAGLRGRPHVVVWNKVDLVDGSAGESEEAVATSALTGEGMDGLRAAILRALDAEGSVAETALLNNLRQHEHLMAALGALGAAAEANAAGLPHEVLLLDLHAALRSLDALTGTTTTEDILARIFSTFCIGK